MTAVCLSCVALTAWAVEAESYPRGDRLIEPAAAARAATRGAVLLDVRDEADFRQGHIPGAQPVDHDAWKEAFRLGQDRAGWRKRIANLGIDSDSTVIVYDDVRHKNAARIWWILRYWGLQDVRLLNGGWEGCQAADLPLAEGAAEAGEPGDFRPRPRKEMLATQAQVLARLDAAPWQIVDARSADEHCGLDVKAEQGGAIPGAVNLEWSDLLVAESARFKSPSELKRLFREKKIDLGRPAVTHCQSGGCAAVMVFGLELMGAKRARNYYRGWSEWGNDPDAPVWKPRREDTP